MYYYYAFIGIVLFAGLAMTVQQGIWSNLITLIAIVLGGLTAYGAHQPLAVWIDQYTEGSYTYFWDILLVWLVFAITCGLIKEIAARLSKNRVNFPEQVDNLGGAAVGLLAAYVLMAFTLSTLHAAPLSYDQFGGTYEYGLTPKAVRGKLDETSALTHPDVAWLRFAETMLSGGTLGREVPGLGRSTMDGFEAHLWVQQQAQHRKTFGEMSDSIVKRK